MNATLNQLNKRFADTLRDCDAGIIEWAKASGTTKKGDDPTSGDWVRKIKLTMSGPRFLSMVATDGFYCGGAHPDGDTIALVFDMESGAQVDWTALIAKSAGASSPGAAVSDGSATRAIVLPTLQAIYTAAAGAECKDVFQAHQSFLLWPDADSGALIAQAADLPHVAAACELELKLTIEQAHKLGFDEGVLSAVQQAHRQQTGKP